MAVPVGLRAELPGTAADLTMEEPAEVCRLRKTQMAAHLGDRHRGAGEQPARLQRHPVVDHLLGGPPGHRKTSPGQGTHGAAEIRRVVLDPAAVRMARLEQPAEPGMGAALRPARLGCSVRTLTRACLAVTGRTAKQVVDDRVALEAQRLLACTNLSVAEIGRRLGFGEPTNFGRFFHREVGLSPGAFRAGTAAAMPAQVADDVADIGARVPVQRLAAD